MMWLKDVPVIVIQMHGDLVFRPGCGEWSRNELHREKNGFLHMRKQRRISASTSLRS